MTRARAIEELKDIKSAYANKELGELRLMRSEVQALDMAIQALSQEPKEITIEDVKGYCKPRLLTIITNELLYELTHPKIEALSQEPCEDAVSREAVLDVIEREQFKGDAISEIEKLPSVTQKPKTGHWKQYGHPWEDKVKCSECGKEQPKILCGEKIIGHWSDFCPYCGAKMESEDKE